MNAATAGVAALLILVPPSVATSLQIDGRVFDEHGTPVPGARVTLLPFVSGCVRGVGFLGGTEVDPSAEVRTGEGGSYRFSIARPGMYAVEIDSPEQIGMRLALLPVVEDLLLPDVRLAASETVTVLVRSASGEPLPAARAVLRYGVGEAAAGAARKWSRRPVDCVTDVQGRCELVKPQGERVRVLVHRPGHAVAEVTAVSTLVEVQLTTGALHTIVVKQGVVGFPEVLVRDSESGLELGVTDADGRFAVDRAGGKPRALELETRWNFRQSVRLESATERTEVMLPSGSVRRSGRVVERGSGRAVPHAVVWPWKKEGLFAVSDGEGRFELEGLHPSDRYLAAAASGYVPAASMTTPSGAAVAEIPALVLPRAAEVTGRVVDAEGAPIAGSRVSAVLRAGGRGASSLPETLKRIVTRAGEDGSFRLSPLVPTLEYALAFSREGWPKRERTASHLKPGKNDLGAIVLTRGYRLSGIVSGPDAQPLAGAQVAIARSSDGVQTGSLLWDGVTDPDGLFLAEEMPAGMVDVDVQAAGLAPARVRGVEVGPDGSPERLEIALVEGWSLEGAVTGDAGEALSGVEIEASPDGLSSHPRSRAVRAHSDADGLFFLQGLADDSNITVRAYREGYAPETVHGLSLPQSEPLSIVLLELGSLAGVVRDEYETPLARVAVRVLDGRENEATAADSDAEAWMETDAEGRFEIGDVLPGLVSVEARAVDHLPTRIDDLAVAPGEAVADLVVTLRTGGRLSGSVELSDGSPAAGAQVVLLARSHGGTYLPGYQGAETDGDGEFRLGGLPLGAQRFVARLDGFPEAHQTIEIGQRPAEATFVLEEGRRLRGEVVDEAERPLAGVLVRLRSQTTTWAASGQSDADGRFALGGASDDSYRLYASLEGYAPYASGRLDPSSFARPIRIRLSHGARIVGRLNGLDARELSDVAVVAANAERQGSTAKIVSDGSYSIESLGIGAWTVRGRSPSAGKEANGSVAIERVGEEVYLDLDFAAGLLLEGSVVKNGEPVSGALVLARGLDALRSGRAHTDRAGRFSIEGLARGRYQLAVMKAGAGILEQRILELEGSELIEIDLATGPVWGTVRERGSGRGLPNVQVTLGRVTESSGMKPYRHRTTDQQGSFSFDDVVADRWLLQLSLDGYEAQEHWVDVDDSGSGPHEIELEASEGFGLVVTRSDGSVPRTVSVAWLDEQGHPRGGGEYPVDRDGTVEVSGLPPGRWLLAVAAGGTASALRHAEVPGADLHVQLQPGGALRVRVVSPSADLTTGRVRVVGPQRTPLLQVGRGGSVVREWPMVGGAAIVEGVPRGSWTVEIVAGGEVVGSAVVTMTEAPIVEVEVLP